MAAANEIDVALIDLLQQVRQQLSDCIRMCYTKIVFKTNVARCVTDEQLLGLAYCAAAT